MEIINFSDLLDRKVDRIAAETSGYCLNGTSVCYYVDFSLGVHISTRENVVAPLLVLFQLRDFEFSRRLRIGAKYALDCRAGEEIARVKALIRAVDGYFPIYGD